LFVQEHYDDKFVQQVYSTPLMTLSQVLTESRPELPAVRLQYSDKQGFKAQAKQLGIMDDLKVIVKSRIFNLKPVAVHFILIKTIILFFSKL
jgi:hypothetical protein